VRRVRNVRPSLPQAVRTCSASLAAEFGFVLTLAVRPQVDVVGAGVGVINAGLTQYDINLCDGHVSSHVLGSLCGAFLSAALVQIAGKAILMALYHHVRD